MLNSFWLLRALVATEPRECWEAAPPPAVASFLLHAVKDEAAQAFAMRQHGPTQPEVCAQISLAILLVVLRRQSGGEITLRKAGFGCK